MRIYIGFWPCSQVDLAEFSETMSADLPSFDAPPVNETVLGVEFTPLAKWSIPHFGLFWSRIRDEYPRCDKPQDILRWMDEARAWIVNSFAELTTPSMHKLWERRS